MSNTRDWFRDVYDFHLKFNCAIGTTPDTPTREVRRLRDELEWEEMMELEDATRGGDIPKVADSIVDLIYVLLGRAVSYGIDVRPVWDAVHAANMAKVGGATRGDGKILKPAGWVAPDVAAILATQLPLQTIEANRRITQEPEGTTTAMKYEASDLTEDERLAADTLEAMLPSLGYDFIFGVTRRLLRDRMVRDYGCDPAVAEAFAKGIN